MPSRKPKNRRSPPRSRSDLAKRVAEVAEMARANRRELELQFQRIADMQAELDALKRVLLEDASR